LAVVWLLSYFFCLGGGGGEDNNNKSNYVLNSKHSKLKRSVTSSLLPNYKAFLSTFKVAYNTEKKSSGLINHGNFILI